MKKESPAEQAGIFDAHANTYSTDINKSLSKFGAEHDFFTHHKAWLIPHLLEQLGSPLEKLDILDVGCGTGNLHPLIVERFNSVSGTDVSQSSLDVAAKVNPNVTYKYYNGNLLPYPDAAFDVAFAICVFHHVPPAHWQSLANEMFRVTHPGGMVLILEHNPLNPLTRHIVRTCPLDADAVLLSAGRVKSILRKGGAVDVKFRSILNLPPKGDLLRRLDVALGLLPVGAQYVVTGRKE